MQENVTGQHFNISDLLKNVPFSITVYQIINSGELLVLFTNVTDDKHNVHTKPITFTLHSKHDIRNDTVKHNTDKQNTDKLTISSNGKSDINSKSDINIDLHHKSKTEIPTVCPKIETITIKQYCKQFPHENKINIKNFIQTREKINFEDDNNLIIIEPYDADIFYDIRFPKHCKSKSEIEYILSTASSRIRYPLTNIVGLIPVIQTYNKDNKQYQKYVDVVQDSGGDIISVANDLVDILNYKKRKIIVKKEEINVNKLIDNCLKIMEKKVKDKKIVLTSSINNDVPKIIYSDKDKIKQILLNLLSNSIKFTKVGSIIISVSVDKVITVKNGNKKYSLLFRVKDTGTGISTETATMLNTLLVGGDIKHCSSKLTGFGLYISNYTCAALGTTLRFNSVVDIGSVFYFSIDTECFTV